MARQAIRGALLFGLVLALARCGDDGKKVTSEDDDGGAANGGEAPSSGGSGDVGETAGAPTTNGGMPGSAGEPGADGGVPSTSGGAPSTSGAPGESGAGGELGMAGGGSCVPTDCCGAEEPTCDDAWNTACSSGTFMTCCDSTLGISRTCGYASGGVSRTANVCVNDCTGHSYGTAACGACTSDQDPSCDSDWESECGETKVYCSDTAAGYRLSCVEAGYDRTVAVECLCDPDVPTSG
jgi:hypothetical protein